MKAKVGLLPCFSAFSRTWCQPTVAPRVGRGVSGVARDDTRQSRPTPAPKRNPPTWAAHATFDDADATHQELEREPHEEQPERFDLAQEERPEPDDRLQPRAGPQHEVRAHHRGDRARRTHDRHRRVGIDGNVRRRRQHTADEIQQQEAPPPAPGFEADPEHPEEQHVPEEVGNARVEEHRDEHRRAGRPCPGCARDRHRSCTRSRRGRTS